MKFINTFLVIALLSFSFSNAFEFASFAEVNEINASPYGKSLLETISMTLEHKGNVGEVQRLLSDLLFKLNQDQERDTDAWNKENARLKAKIAKLTGEIEQLRLEILKLVAERTKYEKLRDKAAENLVQYKQQKARNLKSLAQNEERRNADAAEFRKSQSEHTDVLNAIDAVVSELQLLVGSVSGGARPQHVRQNAEELRDLKKSFLQLTKDEEQARAFIEMATKADQDAVRGLIDSLMKIKRSTQRSYNDDNEHEKRSVEAFNALRTLLTNDNQQLDRMIDQETQNHKTYVNRVNALVKKIAETRALRRSKKAEKKATEEERAAKEKRYNDDKAQRDEERRVIQRIQEIVAKRLANMSKYLDSQI